MHILYNGKGNGIHNSQFCRPEIYANGATRESIEQDLRLALERNELTLQYQPKINLKTGAISGAEALTRWKHPARGSIPPGQFIPIAEEAGLIRPMGAWVLREACREARTWSIARLSARSIAVNISGTEFQSEDFLVDLFAVLGATGLDPCSLEVEASESVLMKNPERAAFILKTLRNGGVRVSIDNFGTGQSGLRDLRKLPLDSLKIDRSLVRQISTFPDRAMTVGTIIGMGRSLNLRVNAQGVETAEDLALLWAYDCDEAQGNFFSEPVPSEQLLCLLQSRSSLTAKNSMQAN